MLLLAVTSSTLFIDKMGSYTLATESAPLGEIGGLHYIWWDFPISRFPRLTINITIYDEPSYNDGLYFQMYQSLINNVGFYFGIQTYFYKPDFCPQGKFLIFSRWGTRDLANVRTVEGGWSQSAGYEGDFVGIRKCYDWGIGKYSLEISYMESDEVGDWYGVWIYDLENGSDD
ncbi:MAG: hypothetical protein V3V81_00145, partial [Candidatus Bathyarchaeia archaeon]